VIVWFVVEEVEFVVDVDFEVLVEMV